MQPPSVTLRKNLFWIFLACLSLAVMLLAGIATSRYGPGVASDSVKYLGVAQSLLDGKGLYDHRGNPLLAWPPLYSIILAGLSFMTGWDLFVAGWYLNIFALGVNVFLSGVIFRRVFPANGLYACLASLFVFLSLPSLRMHDIIGSDGVYLTMTLLFLLALTDYIQQNSWGAFFRLILLCALAPMQRYVGLAFPVTAGLVLLVEHRKSVRVLLRNGLALGFVSSLPILWWLVVHNMLTYGSLFGTSDDQVIDVMQNTQQALTKMLHWFIPFFSFGMWLMTRPFIILGILILALLLVNWRSQGNWRACLQALAAPSVYPVLVHGLIYFIAVACTVVTPDHKALISDRYYVILLVPTMTLVFITYDKLILPRLKFTERQAVYVPALIFLAWSVYPLFGMSKYIAKSLALGEHGGYNVFNTRAYHEMKVVGEMQRLRNDQPDAIVYSNYSDAVWFYTRKPVVVPPMRDVPDVQAAYAGWPQNQPGYLVWFKPNEYKHYLSPEELSQFARFDLIYSDDSGDIYYVQAR